MQELVPENKKLEIIEIRRILRLHHSGRSKRIITEYLGLSHNTVNKYLDLFALSGYTYEELVRRSDQQFKKLFESKINSSPANLVELERLFPVIDKELKGESFRKRKNQKRKKKRTIYLKISFKFKHCYH